MTTSVRCMVLAAILLVGGGVARLFPREPAKWRTEAWMEQVLPSDIPGYQMQSDPNNPQVTYRETEQTYKELKPYGIVCRVFFTADRAIETIVIGGNDRFCFHDPNVCLPGQEWEIVEEHQTSVQTKLRGRVPMTFMRVRSGSEEHTSVYCYKGPDKMYGAQAPFYSDWVYDNMRIGAPPEGAFYRFMSVRGQWSEQELLDFAATFLDASTRGSGGVL